MSQSPGSSDNDADGTKGPPSDSVSGVPDQPGGDSHPNPFDDLLDRLLRNEIDDLEAVLAEAKGLTGEQIRQLKVLGDPTRPPARPALEQVGPYVILEEIGVGGQGVVYLAEDSRIGRRVAVKVLTAWGAASDRAVARFRREAALASRLDHPGICTVYETGRARGVPYLVMGHVPGESLARKLKDGSLYSESSSDGSRSSASGLSSGDSSTPSSHPARARVMGIMEKVARALHAAHLAGVVHRDIKPGNIMITPDGDPVILDFGLARHTEQEGVSLTRTGDVFGTPAYMAPEQLASEHRSVDPRADVWALGVTMYECLTGRRPFQPPTRQQLYDAILHEEPPDLRKRGSSIPWDLAVIVQTAMEKDRDRRYQTALDLAEDLHRVRTFQPILARPVGVGTKALRFVQRNRVPALLLALLIGVLGFGLLRVSHQKDLLVQRNSQLDAKTRDADESARRAAGLAEATRQSLLEWERLADARRLEDLLHEATGRLWPAEPDRIPLHEDWLRRVRDLIAKSPDHEQALVALRRVGAHDGESDRRRMAKEHERLSVLARDIPVARTKVSGADAANAALRDQIQPLAEKEAADELTPREERSLRDLRTRAVAAEEALAQARVRTEALEREQAELQQATSVKFSWVFEDEGDQLRHDKLRDLLVGLEAMTAERSSRQVTVQGMEARLTLARDLKRRAEDEDAIAWERCVDDLARPEPPYNGLSLDPIPGLVPLGRDQGSDLWEFWHVSSGECPQWEGEPLGGGRVRLDPSSGAEGMVLVLIPGGSFTMGAWQPGADREEGSPNVDAEAYANESPVQEVSLEPFLMSKFETTQGQWLRMWDENPSRFRPGTWKDPNGKPTSLRMPVSNISWHDSREAGLRWGLVLPTEAQWEYVCRAGTTTRFSTGDALTSLQGAANVGDLTFQRAGGVSHDEGIEDGFVVQAPVGRLRANPFGLHDVHGNVFEWCLDGFGSYADRSARPGDGLRTPWQGMPKRVLRGGSWNIRTRQARSSNRFRFDPEGRLNDCGVRFVRPVISRIP